MYMKARYYDPVIRRFYSNDPADVMEHLARGNPLHGFNRYAYANNSPLNFVDPDGRYSLRLEKAHPSNQEPKMKAALEATQAKALSTTLDAAAYVPGPVGAIATGIQITIEVVADDIPLSSSSSAVFSETTGQLGSAIDKVESKAPGGAKAKLGTYVAEQLVGYGVEELTEKADDVVNQRTDEEIE